MNTMEQVAPAGVDCSELLFDEDDLDETLAELGVPSDLPAETQRLVAARSMLAFSMAAAIDDQAEYTASLARIGALDIPNAGERAFFEQFSKALVADLAQQLPEEGEGAALFISRAQGLLGMLASASA